MACAFEDFTPGMTIDLGTATVDRDEMLEFARRFDPQPFHVDEQAAKNSMLGGLCASGGFTCSLWMRQYADHVLLDSTSQGSPGGRELAWPAPVFPGIGLECDLEVVTARRSGSRPTMGLVEISGRARQGGHRGPADYLHRHLPGPLTRVVMVRVVYGALLP